MSVGLRSNIIDTSYDTRDLYEFTRKNANHLTSNFRGYCGVTSKS